jgi:hypothetical protein
MTNRGLTPAEVFGLGREVADAMTPNHQAELVEHLWIKNPGSFVEARNRLAGKLAFDGVTTILPALEPLNLLPTKTPEALQLPDYKLEFVVNAYSELTNDQIIEAADLTSVMADKFKISDSDFAVVGVRDARDQRYFLAYNANNGIYKGSAASIMAKPLDERFIVNVDGRLYDTRDGMSTHIYLAMIAEAQARGRTPLPDSIELMGEDRPLMETILTGNGIDNGQVNTGTLMHRGNVMIEPMDATDDTGFALFRPAVMLRT